MEPKKEILFAKSSGRNLPFGPNEEPLLFDSQVHLDLQEDPDPGGIS